MAPSLTDWLAAPLLQFDTIDSTNNYAMAMVNADTALPGTTIVADRQTAGRGQRGRQWIDAPGESLLMSLVVEPQSGLTGQASLSACIALATVGTLLKVLPKEKIEIKWPNDIYVNDRKAGGLLIENVIRGSLWSNAVIGLGLNVCQEKFPPDLPFATSLRQEGADKIEVMRLVLPLRRAILTAVLEAGKSGAIPAAYNERLWRRGELQQFREGEALWKGKIVAAQDDGRLEVQTEAGGRRFLRHGEVEWVMG